MADNNHSFCHGRGYHGNRQDLQLGVWLNGIDWLLYAYVEAGTLENPLG